MNLNNQATLGTQGTLNSGVEQIILNQAMPQETLLTQGMPQQVFLNQGMPQQVLLNQGMPQQVLLNQSMPGVLYTESTMMQPGYMAAMPLQTSVQPGFVPHHQGVPGATLTQEQYAVQSVLQGAGAQFHPSNNLGPASGIDTGIVGSGVRGPMTGTSMMGAPLTGAPLHGAHHGTGLATGAALGTGAIAGTALASDLDPKLRGTFTFKPIEGKFYKDLDVVGKMDPYCKIKLGLHRGKTSIAQSEGTNPIWNDVITLEKKHKEEFAKLKVKDHDKLRLNDKIGEAKIPLGEIMAKGSVQQWYPVFKKDKQTGEVLMENTFVPRGTATI